MKPHWMIRPQNKFHNIPKRYNGQLFHSTLEADYCAYLDLLKKGKEIKDYQTQPKFALHINGVKLGNIVPDFLVINKFGGEEVHEVKGRSTPLWKWRWEHLQIEYPQYKYYVIKKGDF